MEAHKCFIRFSECFCPKHVLFVSYQMKNKDVSNSDLRDVITYLKQSTEIACIKGKKILMILHISFCLKALNVILLMGEKNLLGNISLP